MEDEENLVPSLLPPSSLLGRDKTRKEDKPDYFHPSGFILKTRASRLNVWSRSGSATTERKGLAVERLEELRQAARSAQTDYEAAKVRLSEKQKVVEAAQIEVDQQETAYLAALRAYTAALEQEAQRNAPARTPRPAEGEFWEDPGPDFVRIIEQTASRKAHERMVANRALQRMGPKAVAPLLQLVRREVNKQEKRLMAVGGCALSAIGLAGAQFVVPELQSISFGLNIYMLFGLMLIYPLRKPTRLHRLASETLARIEDMRVVGPLAQALELGDPSIAATAEKALIQRLPQMRASDAAYLAPEQRDCLYRALGQRALELSLAILKALEQIGDQRALPLVSKLAEQEARTHQEKQIKEAAKACLPYLVDRTLEGRAGNMLLRAASQPEAPPDTLLRPAQAVVSEADAQDLLRASHGNTGEAE